MSRKKAEEAFKTASAGVAGGLIGRALAIKSGLRCGSVLWTTGGVVAGAGLAAPAIGLIGGVAIALAAVAVVKTFTA